MASRIVDGARIPQFVAHHQALELCNTRAGWGLQTPKEYLVDFHALAVWARENELLTMQEYRHLERRAVEEPRRARAALAAAHRARARIYDALTCDADAPTMEALRALVTSAAGRSHYVADAEGLVRLDVPLNLTTPVDRAVLAVHRMLETSGLHTVHRCPGEGCGWLFFDPAMRRRWCIMAVCGNRAKARRFAERQRS